MYGVLYAISPEIFPAKDRGTGNGLTATATRLFAILVSNHISLLRSWLSFSELSNHSAFTAFQLPMADSMSVLTVLVTLF